MKRKILVTAALPYINNVPHMGHVVGSHLPADIFHRYVKSAGHESIFVGGSDEHGTPSVVAAKELGIPTSQLVGRLHQVHASIYEKLGISYTNYSRTSNEAHHENVRDFFRTVNANGFITSGKIEMFYCENDRIFLPDRFVVGKCPRCGYESANADQCEQCGSVFSTNELVEPHCKSCGSKPTIRESEHIYLELQAIQPKLAEWVSAQNGVWREHVFREANRWITEGLRHRSISRDLSWGIKIPMQGFEEKVFYVWFDAPIAYMSFTSELGKSAMDAYWKDPETRIFHFLGKDNIPFHTIFWPAMLLAHGGLNLPSNVVGYNYLMYEGQKFSKSKGVGVFCYNLLSSDVDVDTLRAYLTTVIPETKDSSFSWDEYRNFVNSDVIGKFGNYMNRTINLVNKLFAGKLDHPGSFGPLDTESAKAVEAIREYPKEIGDLIMGAEIRKAFAKFIEFSTVGNVFIDRVAPWKQAKESLEDARTSLFIALTLARSLAITGAPFMPFSMRRLWTEQLRLPGAPDDPNIWDSASEFAIPRDHTIGLPVPLYAKIDESRLASLRAEFSRPYSLKDLVS